MPPSLQFLQKKLTNRNQTLPKFHSKPMLFSVVHTFKVYMKEYHTHLGKLKTNILHTVGVKIPSEVGSTVLVKKWHGLADLHTPIHLLH